MTVDIGLDSAFAPTLIQAQQARAAGYTWWGFYLPKLPNTDPLNGWTIPQMQVLLTAGIQPVPICVPSPPAPADPIQTATEYFNLAKQYGLNPKVAVCYNGEHISVTGPVWLPVPQSTEPTAVGPGSALQWGSGSIGGLSVDLNVSALDWPGDTSLVCDLEHGDAYTSEWYATFQSTIARLATPVTPPPPPKGAPFPLEYPPGVKPFKSWQVVVRPDGIWDFITEGADNNIYQAWWTPTTDLWSGPQKIA